MIDDRGKVLVDLEQTIVERKTRRTALERERDAADMSYKGILNRIEEARLSADENTATMKIVEPARVPEKPIWPKKSVVLAVAVFLGLAAGVGLAFFTDTMEDHVTSPADIEQDLGLKMIGVVPHAALGRRDNVFTADFAERFGVLAEAFAGIRGLLDSPQYESVSRSVLITSTAPGEGKTLSSCSLGVMSAKSGRRTLLVDFDLRRPRIVRAFGLKEDSGWFRISPT